MSYKDVPIEPVLPPDPLDPFGNKIISKPRDWKYLIEMSYDELIDQQVAEQKRQRV